MSLSTIKHWGADVGWFSDVPDTIEIGSNVFVVAGEAIENWESRLMGPRAHHEWGWQGPDSDWPGTALLLLARPQLNQAVSILMSRFGIDARLFSGSEVSER